MNEAQDTPEVDPLAKTLDKIGAYSEIGFVSCTETNYANIEHLDTTRKWNVIPRPLRGAHRPNGKLTFGDALEAMKLGYLVRRTNWGSLQKPLGFDKNLKNNGKLFNHSFSGHSCPGGDCPHCAEQAEKAERSYPPGAFYHPVSERFSTVIQEMNVRDILATDWMIVGKRDAV